MQLGYILINSSDKSDQQLVVYQVHSFYSSQVVYSNDDLRAIMREYNITLEEIQKMLDQFIEGGEEAMTIRRTNPDTGLQEVY